MSLVLAAGLLGLTTQGCRSSKKPESARFASVEIRGFGADQISTRVQQVFREDGYSLAQENEQELIFEKKASTYNNIAYGNWLESVVWVRVKVKIVYLEESCYRVECHAYLLRDHGANTEEEMAVSSVRSHPYQKLLNKVAELMAPHKPAGKNAPPAVSQSPAQ
jgi:hypothetical protein